MKLSLMDTREQVADRFYCHVIKDKNWIKILDSIPVVQEVQFHQLIQDILRHKLVEKFGVDTVDSAFDTLWQRLLSKSQYSCEKLRVKCNKLACEGSGISIGIYGVYHSDNGKKHRNLFCKPCVNICNASKFVCWTCGKCVSSCVVQRSCFRFDQRTPSDTSNGMIKSSAKTSKSTQAKAKQRDRDACKEYIDSSVVHKVFGDKSEAKETHQAFLDIENQGTSLMLTDHLGKAIDTYVDPSTCFRFDKSPSLAMENKIDFSVKTTKVTTKNITAALFEELRLDNIIISKKNGKGYPSGWRSASLRKTR